MSTSPTLEDIMAAGAPFVVAVDWGFTDPDSPVAREWARRAEVNDRVWRVLGRLRDRAEGERRLLHKNQQYAHGYGASLRKLHEMAKTWPEQGRVIEAQRFAHAYGSGPQKMGRWLRPGSPAPVRTENYMVQSRAAAEHMSRLHEAMLEAGWEWDGMDGYTAPSLARGEED